MATSAADKAGAGEQTYLLFPLKGKTLNQFKIGVFPLSLTHYHTHAHIQRERNRERERERDREKNTHTHI